MLTWVAIPSSRRFLLGHSVSVAFSFWPAFQKTLARGPSCSRSFPPQPPIRPQTLDRHQFRSVLPSEFFEIGFPDPRSPFPPIRNSAWESPLGIQFWSAPCCGSREKVHVSLEEFSLLNCHLHSPFFRRLSNRNQCPLTPGLEFVHHSYLH